MNIYSYSERTGKREISLDEFQKMCQDLAEQVSKEDFDLIIGITKDVAKKLDYPYPGE